MNSIQRGVAIALQSLEKAAVETAAFTKGQLIEIEAEDGKWYPATVTSVRGEKVTFIYDGADKPSSSWQEFVRPAKEKPKPAAAPVANEEFLKAKARYYELDDKASAASKALRAIPGISSGPSGLTPDAVKQSPEFKQANQAYVNAAAELKKYSAGFVKKFAKELRAERADPDYHSKRQAEMKARKEAQAAPVVTPTAPKERIYTREDFTDAQFKLATKAWKTINDLVSAFGEQQKMKVYEAHHLFQVIRPKLMEAILNGETDQDKLVLDALNSVKLGNLTGAPAEPAEPAEDSNIGRAWPNRDGVMRRVTGKTTVGGKVRYTVRDDNQTGNFGEELVDPDDLDKQVERETKLADSNKVFREGQAAQQAERDAKEAERRSLDGFEDTFTTPMAKERAIKTLTGQSQSVNGIRFKSRKDAIKDLVLNKGYRVTHLANGNRILQSPSRSHFSEKDFTKIGLDYAEHLSKGI